jgi:hypothetical protein
MGGISNTIRNFAMFALLFAILAGVHFIIAANPGVTRSIAQAAVFQWWFLGIVAAAGGFGVFFLRFTSLRGLWDPDLSLGAKLIVPLIVGAVIGIAYSVGDARTGFSAIVASKMHLTSIHIAWPMSVPIYLGGAILVSILYFLVLIPPTNWLIAQMILKGRGEPIVYWLTAIPLALVEPLTQGDFSGLRELGWTAVPNLVGDLAINFAQVWFLRRAGFVACVAIRVGFYAVWHIVYPLI